MAAGYRSNAARWLGGAAASTVQPGYRSICARWLGGASAYTGPPKPGYRSICAFWLGGASGFTGVIPPAEEGTWGRVSLPSIEIRLKEKPFGDEYSDEEQAAILAAVMWTIE